MNHEDYFFVNLATFQLFESTATEVDPQITMLISCDVIDVE